MSDQQADTALIELQGVSRTFAGADGPVRVLADISLRIDAGEFVCVHGPSGSGKSTLLHILGCLDTPSGGSYRLAGREVGALHADALATLRRETFGFVFQSYNLLDALNAEENAALPAKYANIGAAARRERARALLGSLGLADRAGHRPPELSGGEQQRVAIARALVNGGRVILADEPTGALDTAAGAEVLDRLAALAAAGHAVVVVSHDAGVAARAGRRVALREGRIVSDSGADAARPALPAGPPPVALPRRGRVEAWRSALGDGWRALARLWRHRRLATTLSIASVAMGVWALLVLTSLLAGARVHGVTSVIAHLGADRIYVMLTGTRNGRTPAPIDRADAAAIRALPNVYEVEVSTSGKRTAQFEDRSIDAFVNATDATQAEWPLQRGVYYTARDGLSLAPVVVIGSDVAAALFAAEANPVGKHVLLGGHPFEVVGVLAPREASFLESQWMADLSNKWAYVPFASGLTFLFEDKRLDIWARVRPEHIERTARAIQDLLVARHGGLDGFYVRTSSGSLAEWTRMQALLERVWTVAGGILVLLGGFGVMATSWMTARSRRREVAIRMAAGARRRDVLRQFLGEASAVSVAGGVLGVGASLATLLAMARIPAPVVFSPWPALVALACTAALGVAFGILPARRAAGMDPVAALRLEEAT